MIKKLLIPLLIFSLLLGCEEIPNDTIDTESVEYTVQDIVAPKVAILSETSEISTTITIDRSETVKIVWFNVESVNGGELLSIRNEMFSSDKGSRKTYYGQFGLSEELLPGLYEFSYYVKDAVNVEGDNVKKVGTKQFRFSIVEENVPPILTNLELFETTPQGSRIKISIRVIDSNGPEDIKNVFFNLYDPDGQQIYYDENNDILEFPLLDDGTNGDERKNDGIYSTYFTFPEDAVLGNWKFQFGARDQSDEESKPMDFETNVTINYPPVIRNLNIPDNIDRGIEFIFTIEASDPNGLSDIYLVYFELRRPDGSIVYLDEENQITTFPMFDNGDTEGSGDQFEGDGIYSLKNSFSESTQSGTWEFTFSAIDNSGTVSNTIISLVLVN